MRNLRSESLTSRSKISLALGRETFIQSKIKIARGDHLLSNESLAHLHLITINKKRAEKYFFI